MTQDLFVSSCLTAKGSSIDLPANAQSFVQYFLFCCTCHGCLRQSAAEVTCAVRQRSLNLLPIHLIALT